LDLTVAVVSGTRPDIIKIWPVYQAIKDSFRTLLIKSGQHDSLADQAFKTFQLTPDRVAYVSPQEKRKLGFLNSALIAEFTQIFENDKPDLVLVHGDTVTAFSAACAAFQAQIPIGHIEAGLRTSRFEYPFPEEGYRRAISRFTTLHFAPTAKSAANLRGEGINHHVYVTGNTVVDALSYILKQPPETEHLCRWLKDEKYILVTCHRRESYGIPLRFLCRTVELLSKDTIVIWPIHSNPQVADSVHAELKEHDKLYLLDPLEYKSFTHLLKNASLCITDSGGVMEEAAVLGVPTLVLRTETERPEVLDLDNVQLVGYDFKELIDLAARWLHRKPNCYPSTVFGDGTAGQEIADIIMNYFNDGGKSSDSLYGEKQLINTT
jgi:UDP-N-acetylglucosamine 2-epimerase (non-hydrolysing)